MFSLFLLMVSFLSSSGMSMWLMTSSSWDDCQPLEDADDDEEGEEEDSDDDDDDDDGSSREWTSPEPSVSRLKRDRGTNCKSEKKFKRRNYQMSEI